MSLRILFADDSMTAQNMGKKILSEAGYDVVAVSNGAAAVKKIAEQKPDIIILDVYMPGYSGLEVCEKVRGSIDTVKTPVLLTVGKMEPYKPEDANRVKADGVIIKPFEATDLLAIVKKFEERIALMPPPPIAVAPPPRPEPKYEEEHEPHPPVEPRSTSKSSQPMVEVPDHMASSSAFSDLLGASDLPPSVEQHFGGTPSAAFETSVIVPAPPVISSEDEIPAAWKEDALPEPVTTVAVAAEPEFIATPVLDTPVIDTPAVAAPEPVVEAPIEAVVAAPEPEEHDTQVIPVEAVEPEPPHPQFIPVFKEPEAVAPPPDPEASAYEVMPTAAPPTGELEIPKEPALQETAEETTRNTVADQVEPGLMTPIEQLEPPAVAEPEHAVSEATNSFEVAPAIVAPEVMEVTPVESEPAPLPTIELPSIAATITTSEPVQPEKPASVASSADTGAANAELTDTDFEARVAAAMAAYNHADEAPPAAVAESPAETSPASASSSYTAQSFEVAAVAEPAPSFEYHPSASASASAPVVEHAQSASPQAEFVPEPPATPEPVAAQPEAVHSAITSGVEEAAVTAAAETGADHHSIAQAIHRVMERLKPELVEEIMRELKPKK